MIFVSPEKKYVICRIVEQAERQELWKKFQANEKVIILSNLKRLERLGFWSRNQLQDYL